MADIRISKLLKQFNIGLSDLVEFLRKKGLEIDENPNAKVSDEYLPDLQKQFGTTMIYITHDQEEAFAMSDRIMVMDAGVIHQFDTPQNIIDAPADDYVKRFVIKNINTKIKSLIQFARIPEGGDSPEVGE